MEQQNNLQKIFSLQFHDVQRQNIVRPHEIKFEKKDFAPSINNDQLLDRIRGSIVGMATGDALGAHVEFRPRAFLIENPVKELESGGTWGLDKGQFTDDTSMALCLANSLLVCEELQLYDQLLRYKWWYRYGYMSSTGRCFDIGAATRQSLQEFEKRQKQFAQQRQMSLEELDIFSNPDLLDEFDVKCSKEGVAGNGALMRLAPVPLFFFRNPTLAVEYSGQSAQITHGDQKAIDACRYYAALIVAALNGTEKDGLLNEKFYEKHIQWFSEKPLHPDILKIARGSYKKSGGYDEGIRGKGYVVDALEAALWAFWSDDDSFEKGVLDAVNLGDDTDTTAAIYGQLAGIVYGFKGIPSKWTNEIYAKDFLLFICDWIAFSGINWFNKFNNPSSPSQLINSASIKTNSSLSLPSMKSTTTTIEKKAIDSTGQVGFIYDFIKESFSRSDQIEIRWEKQLFPSPIRTCFIKKGNENECQNLLRLIGFDDHLRLSLLSNLIQPKGLASLIDYPFIIDEYTRIIFYSQKTSQDTITSLTNIHLQPSTHLINAVIHGIDLLIILRLSSRSIDEIDRILNEFLRSPLTNIGLLNNSVFQNILSTHLYSNVPHLNEQKTLYDIFSHLSTIIDKPKYHWPCSYFIQSVSKSNIKQSLPIRFHSFSTTEHILMKLASVHKIYSTLFHDNINENIRSELKDQLDEIDNRLNDLDRQFDREKQRVQQFLLQSSQDKSDVIFTEQQLKRFDINIDDFIYRLSDIKQKQDFISELQQHGFTYWNILRHPTNQYNDNFHTIQQKLTKEYPQVIFICSNDYLNLNHSSQLNQFLNQFENSLQKQRIYLDFSYSTYELNQITVLPLINPVCDQPQSTSIRSLNTKPSSKQIPQDKPMNVLLLGKSSVGKSTLINNFANFIKYDTYEKMHPTISTLYVVISFLFPLSNNDSQSETHFISIGNHHENERLVYLNQSTTQRCKSYSLSLKDRKQKINLIDTPGFGKNNNPKDDDVSMQHILSRIVNLTHLDAICIVIQPNETNLQCYQTCLNSLFNCFGQQIQNNIIFIFNKTLSHPIDQSMKFNLIHKLIEPLENQNIHFNEKKILELDSTYFTQFSLWSYLRSLNEEECKRSWQISQNGWNQFITHITQHPQPFVIEQGLQRKQFYVIEIKRLIRPILETFRHTLRDFILIDKKSNCSIEFIPITNNRSSAICYSCTMRSSSRYGPFWIIDDCQHEFHESCNSCCCQSSQHFQTDYTIQYKYLSHRTDQLINFSFDEYLSLILQLSYFIFSEKQNDPFLPYFQFMIEQEKYLSTNINTNSVNTLLYNRLFVLKQKYEKMFSLRIKGKSLDNNLNIDGIIDRFKEIPLIDKQLQVSNLFKD